MTMLATAAKKHQTEKSDSKEANINIASPPTTTMPNQRNAGSEERADSEQVLCREPLRRGTQTSAANPIVPVHGKPDGRDAKNSTRGTMATEYALANEMGEDPASSLHVNRRCRSGPLHGPVFRFFACFAIVVRSESGLCNGQGLSPWPCRSH